VALLIVELGQVSFVDSAGLGVLLYAWKRVQARGGLRLVSVCNRIWHKLHLHRAVEAPAGLPLGQ
jgi:anti-anti-sigma factor